MKTALLKYGSGKIEVNLPDNTRYMEIENPVRDINRDSFTRELLALLPQRVKGNLSLVVSDKTRLCGYGEFLPWIIEAAEIKGFGKENITVYIAYGTHPVQSETESLNAYGESFRNLNFLHHDCDDEGSMVTLGTSSNGTPVTVRKEIPESEAIILFGAISHHYFAGYGGGRKLIFPGLAARKSIYHNHKLFIDFKNRKLHPGCQSGILDGNPVSEDLKEIDRFFPDKIIISGILNKSGEVIRLLAGKDYEDFVSACNTYDKIYRKPATARFDLVIATAGGYPKDINFIQAHKSVHNAASFVKDGGTLILLGECRDGLGNENFISIFNETRENAVLSLEKHYSGNGGTALSMMSKTERIKIYMVTSLDSETCGKLGVTRLEPGAIGSVIDQVGGDIALIENASIIYM